jgi:hypothetical protein
MLLSAGGFAVYLGESNIFNLLAPRFGDLSVRANREKMLNVWLGSRLFRVTGLEREQIENKILSDCRNAGDFLRIFMDETARQQNAVRWAGNAPEEMLHLALIKRTIPEALVIHVIRDGRDVAVSLSQKHYIRPFPWKERETPEGCALYWEWMVRRGRALGQNLGPDYTEVRFEQLVTEPRGVLGHLSSFLEHELDYDRIRRTALGSVGKPNTSFRKEASGEFNPVGRWKKQLTESQLTQIERLVGPTLKELGYSLTLSKEHAGSALALAWTRQVYRRFFDLKLWSKSSRLMRALRPALTSRQVDEVSIADEPAAAEFHRASTQVRSS